MPPMRLVLDTNVWLDWLVFEDAGVAAIKHAAAAGKVEIFTTSSCLAELDRVLGYELGRRVLDPDERAACVARCLSVARRLDGEGCREDPTQLMSLPVCTDPDDQKFLELALACRADVLVTKDRDLLNVPRRKTLPFRIEMPQTVFRSPSAA